MTDREREERKSLMLEIKAREELLRRLEHPQKLIKAAAEKERQKRKERIEKACQFKSYREAQDAYGWELITEAEFDEAVRVLEEGAQFIENEISPVEYAAELLLKIVGSLNYERASFEFDMLPEKEKDRVRAHNEEILARRAARAVKKGDTTP